jgi:peroxiredoxin Q/BCP
MLKQGDPAPDFSLHDQDAQVHNLADYKGKWVVLFAYPKASTSG